MARKKGDSDPVPPVPQAPTALTFEQVAAALLRGHPLVVDEVELGDVTLGSVRPHGDRMSSGLAGGPDEVARMIGRVGESVVAGQTRDTAGLPRRSASLDIRPQELTDPNDSQFAPTEPADWIYDNVHQPAGPPDNEGSTGGYAHATSIIPTKFGMVVLDSWGPHYGRGLPALPDDHPFDHDPPEEVQP
jgi:hypothetical protein